MPGTGWPGRCDNDGGGGVEAQPRQLLLRHPAARQPRDRPARCPHHGERRQIHQPQRLRGREGGVQNFKYMCMQEERE